MGFPSQDGAPSLPPLSLFSSYYIFSYLFLKPMICFAGCLMSSASIQKLFCGIYSVLKCSFDEFLREKVVSLSYSSAILGPPPDISLDLGKLHNQIQTLEHSQLAFTAPGAANDFLHTFSNFISGKEHSFYYFQLYCCWCLNSASYNHSPLYCQDPSAEHSETHN